MEYCLIMSHLDVDQILFTNKVVKTAVEIKRPKNQLELGNMDSFRDWGHSKDYVRAMNMIINHDIPDDFVVATGKTNSVREMTKYVFDQLGLNYENHVIQIKNS